MTGNRILEGIKIVDMTSVIFGPYATQVLADMGADVVKVEAPRGDFFRGAGKPAKTKGMGACHMTLNRGKRAITLDLGDADDAEVMRDLLSDADVFIHNVRKKGVEKLGFGYDDVKAIKPDIVYVHCTGFGSGGPYEPLQCYDDVVQAASGLTSLMPIADRNPKPRYIPSAIVDKVAGLHGVYAVQAGIIHKLRTGEGQFIEVPMFEAFTHFLLEEHLFGATFDPPQESILYKRQVDPYRQPSPTKDGHMSIVPYVDANWQKTFELMGDPDFLEREGLTDPVTRFRNQDKMFLHIDTLSPAKTNAEWMEFFNANNIPCMPARDISDVMNDPHLKATGFFKRREHPTEGGYFEMQPPVRFSARPDFQLGPAPNVDEHGDAIREELAHKESSRMTSIKLYDYFRSSAAYRVRIALNLKNIDYEQVPVNLVESDQTSDNYRAHNPQGLVPTLEIETLQLTQSLAIIEFLDARYPEPPLLPDGTAEAAHVRAMAQIVACDIHPINNLRVLKYLKGELGQDQDAVDSWYAHWITQGFAALEALAQRYGGKHLFGDALGLADICLVPQMYNARRFNVPLDAYPALVDYDAKACALQAFEDAAPEKNQS